MQVCPKIPAQPPHHTTFFPPRIDCQLPSAASVQCRRCRSRPRRHVLVSPTSCGPAPIQSNHLLIPTDAAGRCVRVTSLSYCGGDSPSPTDGEDEHNQHEVGAGRNSRSVVVVPWWGRRGLGEPCQRLPPVVIGRARGGNLAWPAKRTTCASAGRPVRCSGVCWPGLDWTGSVSSRRGKKGGAKKKVDGMPRAVPCFSRSFGGVRRAYLPYGLGVPPRRRAAWHVSLPGFFRRLVGADASFVSCKTGKKPPARLAGGGTPGVFANANINT